MLAPRMLYKNDSSNARLVRVLVVRVRTMSRTRQMSIGYVRIVDTPVPMAALSPPDRKRLDDIVTRCGKSAS